MPRNLQRCTLALAKMAGDRREAAIEVPRELELSEEERKKKELADATPESQKPRNEPGQADAVPDMTEEDKLLKEKLEELAGQIKEGFEKGKWNEEYFQHLLKNVKTEISSSTSSMTSVPKPLKFLRPFYDDFIKIFDAMTDSLSKMLMADILSVMSMTDMSENRISLKYRLLGSHDEIGSWGHEYVRNLSGEIGREYSQRLQDESSVDELLELVEQILPYDMTHNAESEACDLLLEVDRLDWITRYVTQDNHSRVCLYLLGFSSFVIDVEELDKILSVVYDTYKACNMLPDALRVAIKMDDRERMSEVFTLTDDSVLKKQLGFILGSHKVVLDEFIDDDEMMEVIGNAKLHEHYLNLAKDLDVLEVKTPEDIYKTHLIDQSRSRRQVGGNVDSAKQNLASTFVNAFVNAGFSKDSLMTSEGSEWVYKTKDQGKISAVASLGLICLWDLENGFATVDKYTYHNQDVFRAGALLATGLISSGVTSEMDAAFALLSEHTESSNIQLKLSTILGLGFAYAGTAREDILELLCPLVSNSDEAFEVSVFSALTLGFVFVGKCTDDISGAILEALMTRSETDLNMSLGLFLILGLGFLYLGRGENSEAIIEALKIIEHPIRKEAELTVEFCAYCGTGNVLQVQKLLKIVGEHIEEEEKGRFQSISILGVAAIAMSESIGAQMSLRLFDSVLQYAEVNVRRSVPLALGLISVSNPKIEIMETLSKLSHDNDEFVSQNAILGLGLLGAGTNNSRIAQLLRQLSVYYASESNHLFLVRISQGLLYMGKGLLTLNPFYSDGLLMSSTAICGLLTILFAMLDTKNSKS